MYWHLNATATQIYRSNTANNRYTTLQHVLDKRTHIHTRAHDAENITDGMHGKEEKQTKFKYTRIAEWAIEWLCNWC